MSNTLKQLLTGDLSPLQISRQPFFPTFTDVTIVSARRLIRKPTCFRTESLTEVCFEAVEVFKEVT